MLKHLLALPVLAGVMASLETNQSQLAPLIVYCSKCVNVVSLCCSLHAINTTNVLLYVSKPQQCDASPDGWVV